jgi:glycosyltransferase involved in cell wall biosynthesis
MFRLPTHLKLLLFSRAPFIGGAEVACERLALGLMDRGHKVTVVVDQENEVYQRFVAKGLNCKVFRLPFREKKSVVSYAYHWMRLRRFVQKFQPDLVHCNDLPTHQFVSSVAGSLGLPRVCHHRFIYNGKCIDWLNRQGAEIHLFVSNYLKDLLSGESAKLASEPRQVLYDGLPMGSVRSDSDRRQARDKLGIAQESRLVLFAGQVIERKGVKELLDAWKKIDSEKYRSSLVLIGDDIQNNGAYRKQMQSYASSEGIQATFMGFQNNVPEWLQAADIAVVPSREEPLGNATLEAMATGLPVVGTLTGGIPEMIEEEQTGLLVQVNDPDRLANALNRLLEDPELAQKLGQAGRIRCERIFSIATHTDAMIEVFQDLLHSNVKHGGSPLDIRGRKPARQSQPTTKDHP